MYREFDFSEVSSDFLPQLLDQFFLGDVVPKAYTGKYVVQSALRQNRVIWHRQVVFTQRSNLPYSNMTATLTNHFVSK
jgi:hypothetical protein